MLHGRDQSNVRKLCVITSSSGCCYCSFSCILYLNLFLLSFSQSPMRCVVIIVTKSSLVQGLLIISYLCFYIDCTDGHQLFVQNLFLSLLFKWTILFHLNTSDVWKFKRTFCNSRKYRKHICKRDQDAISWEMNNTLLLRTKKNYIPNAKIGAYSIQ